MQHPLNDFLIRTIELLMCQKYLTALPIKFRLEALQISDQRKTGTQPVSGSDSLPRPIHGLPVRPVRRRYPISRPALYRPEQVRRMWLTPVQKVLAKDIFILNSESQLSRRSSS